MRSNWPQAKIRLKSDSNRRLINFFDPNSWNQIESSRQNRLNLVRFISKNLNYIKNRLNLIENVKFIQKSSRFWPFLIKFDLFSIEIDHFRLNYRHLHDFFQPFNRKWSKTDQNRSILIEFRLKLDQNRHRRYDLVVEIPMEP